MSESTKAPVDARVRRMYEHAPFPFVSSKAYNHFEQGFIDALQGIESIELFQGKKVLDVGCGTGEKTNFLAQYAKDIVGLDFSEVSLVRARESARQSGLSNVTFISASILDPLPLPKRSFDVVFCSGVIHHTSNPRKALHHLCSMVASGGVLVFSVYHWPGYIITQVRRHIISLLALGDETRKFKIAHALFYRGVDIGNPEMRAKIYDTYVHPLVRPISVRKLRHWLSVEGFGIRNVYAKGDTKRFTQPLSLFRLATLDFRYGYMGRGFVFVSASRPKAR